MKRSCGKVSPLKRTVFILAILLILPATARTQGFVQTGLDPIDVPVDARSVAMGESFVAVPGNNMALMYNPAALFLSEGARASYSQRTMDWLSFTSDFRYHAATAELRIPQGTIGVLYNRLNEGTYAVASPASPDAAGTLRLYKHMLALGFAMELTHGLSAGAAVKAYDIVESTETGTPPISTSSGSYMLDLGLTYRIPGLTSEGSVTDLFTAGAALQNFGTDLRVKSSDPRTGLENADALIPLPRYLRIGFSYSVTVEPESEEALTPFRFLATAEYRLLVNGPESLSEYRDYWGFGMEATFFTVFAARLGGYVAPWTWVYGVRGVPSLRYGLGMNLPMQRLGVCVPLTLRLDYAGIPLHSVSVFSLDRWTMRSWTIGIDYDAQLF